MVSNINGNLGQFYQRKEIPLIPSKTDSNPKETHKKQNDDPLLKYPARLLAYTNEVGEAIRPSVGTDIAYGFWAPALLYIGADVWDKYKRGENDDYTKPSTKRGIEQGVFQGLASVAPPTGAVKAAQGICEYTGITAKLVKNSNISNHLVSSAIGLIGLAITMKPIDILTEKFVKHVVKPELEKHFPEKNEKILNKTVLDK